MFKFFLPNNKEIDTDMVMMAMEDSNLANEYYFNIKTGEVDFLPDDIGKEFDKLRKEIEESNHHIAIERLPAWQKYNWMQDFAKKIVKDEDRNLYEKLLIALDGKGAFGRFKNVLHNHKDQGWLAAWDQYKEDCLWEEMKSWLDSLDLKIKQKMNYDDNCPICQTMNEEKTSLKDLKKAFSKAKKQGAVVGRKLIDEKAKSRK